MIRDYASTAHVYAADALRKPNPWTRPTTYRNAQDAATQVTLPRRYSPLAHAYLVGFGDAA